MGPPARAHRFLAPPAPLSSLKGFVRGGFNADPEWQGILQRLDQNLTGVDARTEALREDSLGYCGWLLTNPQFLGEHDQFFARWREMVLAYGLPRCGRLPDGFDQWLGELNDAPADAARYAEVYTALLRQKGRSAKTLYTGLVIVKTFVKWALQRELLDRNPLTACTVSKP